MNGRKYLVTCMDVIAGQAVTFYVHNPTLDHWTSVRDRAYEFDLKAARAMLSTTAQEAPVAIEPVEAAS